MHTSFWKSRTFRFWVICNIFILLVPIVASVGLYRFTTDTLTRKAYESGVTSAQQVRNVVDEQLKTVSNVSDIICVSSGIIRLKYLSLPFDANTIYQVHQRAKYLGNFSTSQPLIKYLFAYSSDLACLIDAGHIYTKDNQLDKMIRQRIGLSSERFYELMAQNHVHDMYVINGGRDVILLQTLGTRAREKKPVITLITVLDTSSIRELLQKTSETIDGSAYMLLPDGSVFGNYTEGDPLDYAALSTRYSEGQMTDNKLVVTYADSTVTGFRYVLSVPSITFLRDTTNMKAIFLYSTFLTLVIGVTVAYMLAKHNYKPLQQLKQTAQIGERNDDDFIALGSKLKMLLTADNQMHSEIEQLSRAANAQLFSSLLTGKVSALEQHQRAQLDGMFIGNVFVAALIDLGEDELNLNAEESQVLIDRLTSLVTDCAQSACQCVIQTHNESFAAIFCFAGDVNRNDAQFFVQQIADRMLARADTQPRLNNLCIYIGDAREGINSLHHSFNNAIKAKEYADFITETAKRVVLYDETMYSCNVAWQEYDIVDAERQFSALMMEGNYSRGNQKLREIMAYNNCRDGMSLYVMRCRMFGIMNMLLNVLHEVEPDLGTEFFEEANPVARLLSARTQQELEDAIFEIIDRLVGRQESKSPDMQDKIVQVEHYIAAHYFDVGLGVKQVADAFDVSLPYLSRVFKKERGIGLLNYINQYRIAKAKEILMMDENATVAEIAEKVGYNSSQTLIRIFKRYAGTTPGQFRGKPM